MTGIYQIKSDIDDRFYIGSSVNIIKRWRLHKSQLRRNIHPNPLLQNFYNKYGKHTLIYSTVEECSIDIIICREQYYLDTLNPTFNICKVAGNTYGRKFTEETKIKMRYAQKIKPIHQYDIDGAYICEWYGASTAARYVEGTDRCGIQRCCKGINDSCGNFQWSYEKADFIKPYVNGKLKKVYQYDKSFNLIHIFNSMKEAGDILNIKPNIISRCCSTKRRRSKGFYFFTTEITLDEIKQITNK